MNEIKSIYPSTVYRVSLKAIIRNDKGEVLCVKENGSDWTLPGGGLDHGETIEQGLDRELHEELEFAADTHYTYESVGHDVMYIHSKQAWNMWALFNVTFHQTMPDFLPGVDGDAVAFIDPAMFKESDWSAQQIIYRWCAANKTT